MKIIKKDSMLEEDIKSVILDSTLFKGGQTVEGVAFCKYFKEAITESGKNYVKLYLYDKGYRMFQANMMNVNKNNMGTEVINKWVGKPLVLTGDVSHFMGMNIVNVLQIEKVKEGVYKEEDFIPTAKSNIVEMDTLKRSINNIEREDLRGMREAIIRLAIPEALSQVILAGDFSKIGDGLLVCNRMIEQLERLREEEEDLDVEFYKALIILSTGIFYSVSNRDVKNPGLIDNSSLDNMITIMGIVDRNNVFGDSHKERGLKEIKHLYKVLYMGGIPKTFLSRFYSKTEETIKYNLETARMEMKTTPGNAYKFVDTEYVRI